ncbi:hypothetical protein BV898_05013 [Hypsibius exemplaris]|uniref:EB domain-containing protein n=1 Tax=Hypsibius exemplaris TaxID=2072580 RepID=A0A1W0X0I5_HYPEX|nr:hypothetical protein BV898_05013 [Hypsibius exemplaris]
MQKRSMLAAVMVMVSTVHWVNAAHRGEGCAGNADCVDTGLTCTGARCYCYTDISEETAKFWACNDDQDCPAVKSTKKDLQTDVAADKDSDTKLPALGTPQKILKCVRSTECPLVPGFIGYCNVDRVEAEETM